jgi:hypothetical protein
MKETFIWKHKSISLLLVKKKKKLIENGITMAGAPAG